MIERAMRRNTIAAMVMLRLCLAISASARPTNDNFANAATVNGLTGSLAATSAGASIEPGEYYGLGASVWYRWIADQDGVAEFNTDGSAFDARLVVGLVA